MFTKLNLILTFLLIPFFKMKKVDSEIFIQEETNKGLIYSHEKLYSVYDNAINSFLVTNTRIIGVFKLKLKTGEIKIIKIFSIPLFQLGTIDTYKFKKLKINILCLTSSPGYNFYWFFDHSVSMQELSNEISIVVADVQISGGSKLKKLE
ncbi:MAG: hypothetical protein ACRCUA_02360 [Fusobacteriaceae bacterium]